MPNRAHYRNIALSLREEAARPEVPKEQVEKALSLAEYFEKLADDPTTDATDRRFS